MAKSNKPDITPDGWLLIQDAMNSYGQGTIEGWTGKEHQARKKSGAGKRWLSARKKLCGWLNENHESSKLLTDHDGLKWGIASSYWTNSKKLPSFKRTKSYKVKIGQNGEPIKNRARRYYADPDDYDLHANGWPLVSKEALSHLIDSFSPTPKIDNQPSEKPQAYSHFSEPKLERWYQSYVNNWQEGDAIPSLVDDWSVAKSKVSSTISRRPVEEMRKKYAPDEWKKAGRRKKQD